MAHGKRSSDGTRWLGKRKKTVFLTLGLLLTVLTVYYNFRNSFDFQQLPRGQSLIFAQSLERNLNIIKSENTPKEYENNANNKTYGYPPQNEEGKVEKHLSSNGDRVSLDVHKVVQDGSRSSPVHLEGHVQHLNNANAPQKHKHDPTTNATGIFPNSVQENKVVFPPANNGHVEYNIKGSIQSNNLQASSPSRQFPSNDNNIFNQQFSLSSVVHPPVVEETKHKSDSLAQNNVIKNNVLGLTNNNLAKPTWEGFQQIIQHNNDQTTPGPRRLHSNSVNSNQQVRDHLPVSSGVEAHVVEEAKTKPESLAQINDLKHDVRVLSSYNKLAVPTWQRSPQFLDNVDAFKIHDTDPLAMTLSISSKHGQDTAPTTTSTPMPNKHYQKLIYVANHPGWNWIIMGNTALDRCPVSCRLTADRSEQSNADAVIYYAVGYYGGLLPRPPGQIWIFFSLESPIYSLSHPFQNNVWHNQINWTMTYRTDSDIYYPYGRVNRRETTLATNYTKIALRKTKMIAWFVSHCNTNSKREDYVNAIKKDIPVDVYGNCGTGRCGPEGSYECLEMLTNDYKFYISFENALCDDYVTEKVFRKLIMSDVVPIVRGQANYTRYLPPRSFINVEDFATVSALTSYLNYLNSNITAYTEYLEWRRFYFVIEKPNPTCEVCMKLTEPQKYSRVYEDVYSWWVKDKCHLPKPVV